MDAQVWILGIQSKIQTTSYDRGFYPSPDYPALRRSDLTYESTPLHEELIKLSCQITSNIPSLKDSIYLQGRWLVNQVEEPSPIKPKTVSLRIPSGSSFSWAFQQGTACLDRTHTVIRFSWERGNTRMCIRTGLPYSPCRKATNLWPTRRQREVW